MIKNIEAAKELAAKYRSLNQEEKNFKPQAETNPFTSYLITKTGYGLITTCLLCKSVDGLGGAFPKPNCTQCVWSLIPIDGEYKTRIRERNEMYQAFCNYVHNGELDSPYRLEKSFNCLDYPGISEEALKDFNDWFIKRAEHLEEAILKAESYNAENQ